MYFNACKRIYYLSNSSTSVFMQNEHTTRIFVLEDDPVYARLVKYTAEMNPDHEVHVFATGKECLRNLHLQPRIVTLDYHLPDTTGDKILKEIKRIDKNIEVIILSGQNDISTAVQLLRDGAYDYIIKDQDTRERLHNCIERIKKRVALEEEVVQLREELTNKYQFSNSLLGNSPPMQEVAKLLERAARANITVSITGETGTGKELAAKTIHYNSNRQKGNFVAINVSAIPADLLESELFGHEKGAFTGASARKLGKFELANGGTLFLDEIGEMSLHLQAKLLRALQEREITRIGGSDVVKFDARVIVATHRNLAEEVAKGNFREDLYYRLLGLPVHLPPLRDRDRDILILAKHFLEEFVRNNKMSPILIGSDAQKKLLDYDYPGNVRELRAIIELAAVMTSDNKIRRDDIQFHQAIRKQNAMEFMQEECTMREYEWKIVRHYLKKYNNDILLVAQKLDVGKSTIYRWIKEHKNE